VDKLAIGIGAIIGAIFAQNVMILREIRHMWLSINRVQDAELKVLKTSKERLDAHMEVLGNISDSQVNIANMILLLTKIEKGKEQNAGQSRCGEDFGNEADACFTESGSDGRKED
jgi:signal-transduction protein with cAMP-binding, CBS, and nucleotidyltransferase domain